MTVLLIDNYDSFVFNLARYIGELGLSHLVKRNDEYSIDEIIQLNPSHIIISPGPCTPNEAGISMAVIQTFAYRIPILGVCLGHQAIAQALGGTVTYADMPMHGCASAITHNGMGIFYSIQNPLSVGRYHSLIVCKQTLPDVLHVTATCSQGQIMAIQHRDYPLYGVQFHPESILTECGHHLLYNFLCLKTEMDPVSLAHYGTKQAGYSY